MSVILDPIVSDIGVRQNHPVVMRLLRARQWRWTVAARWQMLQLAVVLAAPVLTVTLGRLDPNTRPVISFVAILFAIADTSFFDRAYRGALKSAAKASELFDTTLFHLDWSPLAAGTPPSPEETDRAERGWNKQRNKQPITNWYSPEVDRAPLPLARAICQRTNLSYDADLRTIYRNALWGVAAVVVLALVAIGLSRKVEFSDFILGAWVPAGPFVAWTLREAFRQADAIRANEGALVEAERLINAIIAGQLAPSAAEVGSRELQNAIFANRAKTVLLLPGIYRLRRDDTEHQMHAGADYWLKKANA
jgi:hypothetical protein